MALFRGIQEYIALDANNITLVFDSSNIVNISGNIFLYPPQGHPILYKYHHMVVNIVFIYKQVHDLNNLLIELCILINYVLFIAFLVIPLNDYYLFGY